MGKGMARTLLLSALLLLLGGTVAFAQLPGDLDVNGEINLFDSVLFADCFNGPDGGSVDSACDGGNFDADLDIDLRDFAGFQARFGFGQGPPQIVSFAPAPGEWVVNDIGLTEVKIGFSEPVIVPTDAVDVWLLSGGTVTGFALSYDPDKFVLTASFASPLRDDQVTVVVDYTIEDVAGNPLDGEILDPKNAALPSGNEINGGQGVFRIRVLQGDANRDGVVDATDETIVEDSLSLCDGDPGFDVMADLDSDGCVDATDANIVTAALGNLLPVTDNVPPVVGIREPQIGQGEFDTVVVDFSESIILSLLNARTCFLVDSDGGIFVPDSVGAPPFGTSAVYTFALPFPRCDNYTINISNAIADSSGELLETQGAMTCP